MSGLSSRHFLKPDLITKIKILESAEQLSGAELHYTTLYGILHEPIVSRYQDYRSDATLMFFGYVPRISISDPRGYEISLHAD